MARPKSPDPKQKITVYAPKSLIKIVDDNIEDLGGTRSQAFALAMRKLLKQRKMLPGESPKKQRKKTI